MFTHIWLALYGKIHGLFGNQTQGQFVIFCTYKAAN